VALVNTPSRTEIAANRRRATALAALPAVVVFIVVLAIAGALSSVIVGLVVGAAAGVATGLGVWWGGTLAVVRLTDARAAVVDQQPRVHNLIDGLCAGAGVPRPALRVIEDEVPNALTIGLHPRRSTVIVTTGLISSMSRIELEAVLAHELNHIRAHDILPATVAVTSLGPVAVLLPAAARLTSWGAGDRREAIADVAAVALTRYPPGLISALEKLGAGHPDGENRRAGARAIDHLWIRGDRSSLDERLQTLREL
jgi:heat shock protein HtpX